MFPTPPIAPPADAKLFLVYITIFNPNHHLYIYHNIGSYQGY